ncbi:MAG: bifunctional pyr operon transcriptional regulator/uracil phosphoribosyltransferase PyrR [Cyanobacteria bacterium M5B4]|nr:MAG: bifunctional pyr operon transcriptional regulator/uracil phosphoribosyltransferase PyrR [Cyanobacteria bacterium M5B4]
MSGVEILSPLEQRKTIGRLAFQLVENIPNLDELVLLGIRTRGVPLAQEVAARLGQFEQVDVPVGALDITFYRDDLDRIGPRVPDRSEVPCDLNGKLVVLVDDVICSGRTAAAALTAVADFGRPRLLQLMVLIDRGHRELPIHPDYTGKRVPTSREEKVKVLFLPTDGQEGVMLFKPQG